MTQSKILNSREVMSLLMICENTLIKLEKKGNIKVDFYVGNRIKALRYCIYYFKRNHYDLKFYLITFIGIIKPSLLPKMNEWRHAIRNQYGF